MTKTTILSVGLVLVAGSALASNTGFKLNYTLLRPVGKTDNNWISVPYFYFPDGNVANNNQTALGFCNDLNETASGGAKGSKVANIYRYDTLTDKPKIQSCTSGAATFNLKKGEGYSLVPAIDNVVVNIVGSHDDTYAKNKVVAPATPTLYILSRPVGKTDNNWFSVPYHSQADDALQICNDLNETATGGAKGSKVANIYRYDTLTDKPKIQSCTSGAATFTPKAGEGLSLVPATDGVGVSVTVY